VALVAGLVAAAPAEAAKVETVTSGADGHSYRPSVSFDGRFVAFESNADSLSRADDDRVRNVYVRDMRTGRVTLVSRGSGPAGAPANGASSRASLSADGRFVAFQTQARNLGLDPGPSWRGQSAAYVRDLRLGVTHAVGIGDEPSLSSDGRYVAYVSKDPAFTRGSDDPQIVRRDLRDGTTVLVSQSPEGAPGDFSSFAPAIAGDGNRVAFESFAENFDRFGEEGEFHKVFLRDVAAGTTERVSRGSGPGGPPGDGASSDPSISGDGRSVAFWTTDSVSFAAGERLPDAYHVWVRELAADRIELVDRASGEHGAPGNSSAEIVSLSHDGRFAAFESLASNLVPPGAKGRVGVFVRDLRAHRTELISRGRERGTGVEPAISGDGRYVVFERSSRTGVKHVMRARRGTRG
jgi:Tol biopolymer transport system component